MSDQHDCAGFGIVLQHLQESLDVEFEAKILVFNETLTQLQTLGYDLGGVPGANEGARDDRFDLEIELGHRVRFTFHSLDAVGRERPIEIVSVPILPLAGLTVPQEVKSHAKRSIFAAIMKSFSCNPLILCVYNDTVA